MASPLSASALLAALKAEGCKVVEYRSWRTHNRNHKGAWGPVNGVVIHHTVSSGEDSSVALCYNGHAELPGPLCHTVGGKSGKLYMVGNGRANHAGSGDDDVLQAVINERALPADNEANTDGNRHFYGIEIVNLGNGKDQYPAVQYDAAVRWAAAICRAHGWNERSVIGHREWQPGKIDPHGPVEGRGDFSMDRFRADVAERLTHPASWNPGTAPAPSTPKEDDMDPIDVWAYKGKLGTKPDPRDAYAYLRDTEARARRIEDRLAQLEQRPLTDDQVQTIAAAVAAHPALAQAIADTLATRLKD